MSRPANSHRSRRGETPRTPRPSRSIFASLTMAAIAVGWWGCNATPEGQTTSTTTTSSSSSGSGGAVGTGGTGGSDIHIDGGGGGVDEAGVCTSTSAEAHRVPLDIVFLIDQSGSMNYLGRWTATVNALTTFANDPASIGISAGLVLFPRTDWDCVPDDYAALNVPIDMLPQNAFAVTNALPAGAHGVGTPMYGALKGALMAATARQDLHPDHKVIVVLATDGWPDGCSQSNDEVVALAQSARSYNGVLTYTIAVDQSVLPLLDKIAAAGGTTKTYDMGQDLTLFFSKIAEIRQAALGCDFAIPPPPNGMQLDADKVNFSYAPKGVGTPKILPRAKDLADCGSGAGWYYDSNAAPTKIILCPASCSTVEADLSAKVDVLFGCKSVAK